MSRNRAALGWRPALGAVPDRNGFRFRVWAPATREVCLIVQPAGRPAATIALAPAGDGTFAGAVAPLEPGSRYGFLLDGDGPFPDPASRWQPDGVHGLSATVDPRAFVWSDAGWRGPDPGRTVIYELHVGAFSAGGTFAGVTERLAELADLGVTAVELMPVADFPGQRNWGYDGASLFAPARCYGTPDDLRRLVDTAHRIGLAVLLDVVYNHFGPDGAYALRFSPQYGASRHDSPWGSALNFDGDGSAHVRAFVLENAHYWLHEFHLDGLRLDATHAMRDDRPQHILAQLVADTRASLPDRAILLFAEDDRNLADVVRSAARGGWGFDGVWADDFHHHVRRLTAGDHDGYYQDYSGDTADLARTIRTGWFYTGQVSSYRGAPRGTDPAGVPSERMVICLQNHDQVGNRAFGDRLHHAIDPAAYRALTVLLLTAPETPLLFMGQEWAASTPFLFFTDHVEPLGARVTLGRREEFARFRAFQDAATRARIPDPQAATTFEASRLQWHEVHQGTHARTRALYRALLALRRRDPALASSAGTDAAAPDGDSLAVLRAPAGCQPLLVAVRFRSPGRVDLGRWPSLPVRARWSIVLTSEDEPFVPAAERLPPRLGADGPVVTFERPSAVVLRAS
jgi:maltooligosyltrehalose trehalohydrolase